MCQCGKPLDLISLVYTAYFSLNLDFQAQGAHIEPNKLRCSLQDIFVALSSTLSMNFGLGFSNPPLSRNIIIQHPLQGY
jgi:hypothetical protein